MFVGPVPGAIYGRLSESDLIRIAVKFLAVGAATTLSSAPFWRDPEVMTFLVAPLVAGTIAGLWEGVSRWQQGRKPVEKAETKSDG